MEELLKLTKEVTRSFESKDEELALDVLRQLDAVAISKEALQAAGLGLQLARLSKAEWSERAAEQARNLVNKWKGKLRVWCVCSDLWQCSFVLCAVDTSLMTTLRRN